MSTKPLVGFNHLFSQLLPELSEIDEQIYEKLERINLSKEIPLVIIACRVDTSRYKLDNSHFDKKQYGLYLLMYGESKTSLRCLRTSEEEHEPALKGVALAAKLLLKREVIPFVLFDFHA